MSRTLQRRTAILAVASLLVLAGCSDDSEPSAPTTPAPTSGSSVTTAATACTPVTDSSSKLIAATTIGGELGTAPTLKVDPKLEVTAEEIVVACNGDGPAIAEGDIVSYLGRAVSVADSTELGVTENVAMMQALKGELAEGGLAGLNVGTRLVLATPNDGAPAVQVLELVASVPGVPVVTDKKVGDEGLPTADAPAGKKPTITIPEGGVTSEGVTRVVLTEGDGEVLKTTDKIAAHYVGVKGSDGEQFDASWDRGAEPLEFGLDGVVAGWTHGLAGLKVGTTVLLVIPPAYGYGLSAGNALQADTLVFVVTIEKLVTEG
ncbi:hypothetical protein HF995_11245 [Sanguibacter hominis ATCC BAA-789]|uniref:Peptidyl-prolyl cis-trans isomerase n=1 Tax=Sanguibacter hominis ATCC BAA-789 TaxID=1312740 RepID=A0A9X5FEJ2_9MICO|nr:FKBP-type peptidyl-prolyl cis-trans isomerase [Sanguibacter hominis]NKX93837.1 hypothetical protein [Sanguibacter hominis ATCC BAA-789]